MSVSIQFGEWFNKIGEQSSEILRYSDQDWSMIMTISLAVILYGIMGLRNA